MTTFIRGDEGQLAFGTLLEGSPITDGIVGNTSASMDIDATSLVGVVVSGSTFTFASETGNPVHTVTNTSFKPTSANAISSITFTPAVIEDIPDGDVVQFVSALVSQVIEWTADAAVESVERTVKKDTARQYQSGMGDWNGSARCYFDSSSARHTDFLDKIHSGLNTTYVGCVFDLDGSTMLYGSALATDYTINSPEGSALLDVTFTLKGTGGAQIV